MDTYEAFAAIYDEWSAHMTEDVPFYVELACETDGPLVELAVGSGRVAIPVAQDTERPVIGIDSSPAMLAQARERVAAALRPGGRFAWNAFCFSYRVAAESEGRNEGPVPHTVRHSPAESRIDITLDGGGATSLWWATKAEWEGLLDVAGLETEALYGWFDRRPFDDESEEFVWVARKPA